LSSQISSEPRDFNAALSSFQLVVRYFGFAGAVMPSVYPVLHASHEGQFVQQSDADGDDLTYTNTHVGKTALPPRGALVTDDGVTINVTDIIANISCRNGSHRMGALM
jgi:hypothetical protein